MGIGKGEDIARLNDRIKELRIGIMVDDFSKVHDLIAIAKGRGIGTYLLSEDEDREIDLDCLLVDSEERLLEMEDRSRITLLTMEDPEGTIERGISAGLERFEPDLLLVGIDPGKKPGMAFISDGRLVSIFKAVSEEEVIGRIGLIEEACRPDSMMIRLGDGAPASRDRIRELLEKTDYTVEIVDERRTSTSKRFRDEVAAISIAHTKGERILPEYPDDR